MNFLGITGAIIETERDSEELSVQWQIPNFFSLSGKGGDIYESPEFDFSDARWCLGMFSNGGTRNPPSGWMDLFLKRKDKGPPLTIHFTLSIEGENGVGKRREAENKFSIGSRVLRLYFLERQVLRDHQSILVPNSTMTISCRMKCVVPSPARDTSMHMDQEFKEAIALTEESPSLEKQGVEEWQKSLLKLLESGKESDVVIKVKGKEFPAHRILLQARSTVFEAMFSHDMVEKQSGIVTMKDCDPETFPDFLKYVYTGSPDMISSKNVFSLFSASHKYDLNTLKEQCVDFMKKNLAVASFCESIALAVKYDEKELIELATKFFCANTFDIVKTVEWQTFLAENPTVGNELFILSCSQKK